MAFEILPPGGNDKFGSRIRRRDAQPQAFQPGERPHNLETEQSVLCSVLFRNEVLPEVQDVLTSKTDFFLPAHQEIFEAMLQLSLKNIPIDLRTVSAYLRDHGKIDSIGGEAYLAELANYPAVTSNAVEHSKIISDLSWRRKLIEASEICRGQALDAGDTRDIASSIEKIIFGATQQKKSGAELILARDLVMDAISELEKRAEGKIVDDFAMSGLKDLDSCLNGFRPGQLLVLAAGPGTGKTSLAANVMTHIAIKQQKPILFFSLEMTRHEVVNRVLSFTSGIDSGKLRLGNLQPQDFHDLYVAAEEMNEAPLYINDQSVLTPYDILAQTRKLKSTLRLEGKSDKIGLIIVDYIQIMKSGSNSENRALEVAAITGGLKMIAKEMEVPVLALSQLNRDKSRRTGDEAKRPQLSDLKDSGAIEADADVVMFIHREMGPDQDSRAPAEAEIIVAKQRSGPTQNIKVTWLGSLTRFTDYINSSYAGGGDQYSSSSSDVSGPADIGIYDPV